MNRHSDVPTRLDGLQPIAETVVTLTRDVQRDLAIFTRDLDARIFGTAAFVAAVRALALSHRLAHIRVVVAEPATAVAKGHRLIDLSQRLSSFIEIRRADDAHRTRSDNFILADRRGLLLQPDAALWHATAHVDAPALAADWLEQFERIWAHAQPDPGLRRLHV